MRFPRYRSLPSLTTETPLVSVVMFCRNRVYSINQAVESLQQQTYPYWELIIQDGASQDGTREALESYTDPRIKLVSEPDDGPFEAMWRALRRCRGDLIGFCLSDEALFPQALQEAVTYFLCHPEAAALHRDLYYTDLQTKSRERVDSTEFNLHDYLGQQSKMSLVTVLFRRIALDEIGFATRTWRTDCADFELIARIGEYYRFDYYPGPSALFAQGHEGQLSTTPEIGFFCTQGHLHFIDEFYRESTERTLLRDLALRNAFEPVKNLYAQKGSPKLQARLETLYAEFGVQEVFPSLELVDQMVGLGLLDLALGSLQSLGSTTPNPLNWIHLTLEIFGQFCQQTESLEKWKFLADQHYPGAYERWLNGQLRVGQPNLASLSQAQVSWEEQLQVPPCGKMDPRTHEGPIKIAFHCLDWTHSDIRAHILPFLSFLPTLECEVICLGSERPNLFPWPEKIHFLPGFDRSPSHFVEKVRAEKVDVFIELSGYSTGPHWPALAARCAFRQISYSPTILPSDLVDYVLSDPFLAATQSHPDHPDKFLRLPECYTHFPTPVHPAGISPRRLDDRITLGSTASSQLINLDVLQCWTELLQRSSHTRLLLSNPELNASDCRLFFRDFFQSQGISGDRLFFVGRSEDEPSPYLIGQMDLYLDTFPYSDGSGVARALAHGRPAVTLLGPLPSSRLGGSLMTVAGLVDSVATTPSEYIEQALAWSTNRVKISNLRRTLPGRLQEKGLADPARFAQKFRQTIFGLLSADKSQGGDPDSVML